MSSFGRPNIKHIEFSSYPLSMRLSLFLGDSSSKYLLFVAIVKDFVLSCVSFFGLDVLQHSRSLGKASSISVDD